MAGFTHEKPEAERNSNSGNFRASSALREAPVFRPGATYRVYAWDRFNSSVCSLTWLCGLERPASLSAERPLVARCCIRINLRLLMRESWATHRATHEKPRIDNRAIYINYKSSLELRRVLVSKPTRAVAEQAQLPKRPHASALPGGRGFPPQLPALPPISSRRLPFPKITPPEAQPACPERHVANSIATMRRHLIVALASTLTRCLCCSAPGETTHATPVL